MDKYPSCDSAANYIKDGLIYIHLLATLVIKVKLSGVEESTTPAAEVDSEATPESLELVHE